jgi:hypothetical protein
MIEEYAAAPAHDLARDRIDGVPPMRLVEGHCSELVIAAAVYALRRLVQGLAKRTSRGMRTRASGVPQPVTGSQPGPAW